MRCMGTFRVTAAVLGVGIVVIYVLGSSFWVGSNPGWYRSLNAPSFQPPDFVFGLIWPYNFIVLGITAVVMAQTASSRQLILWLVIFASSVAAALVWSYLFYVPHNLSGASVALVIAALLTLPLLIVTWQVSVKMALLLIPYQIWVTIASTISIGYALKN